MYHTEQFEKDLLEWDIVLTDRQLEQFLLYYEMLLEWNQLMNLTAITEYEEVMKKHFTDSLSLVKAMELTGSLTLIDVGSRTVKDRVSESESYAFGFPEQADTVFTGADRKAGTDRYRSAAWQGGRSRETKKYEGTV